MNWRPRSRPRSHGESETRRRLRLQSVHTMRKKQARPSSDFAVRSTTARSEGGSSDARGSSLLAGSGSASRLLPPPCRARAGRNLCVASGRLRQCLPSPTVAGTGARGSTPAAHPAPGPRVTVPETRRPARETVGGWPWTGRQRGPGGQKKGPASMKDLQHVNAANSTLAPCLSSPLRALNMIDDNV